MAKLSAKALAKYEASRNLGEELLAAAREIKAGKALVFTTSRCLRFSKHACARGCHSRNLRTCWASLPARCRDGSRGVVNPRELHVPYW